MITDIPKVQFINMKHVRIAAGMGMILFLMTVILLINYIIAKQELKHEQLTRVGNVRVSQELLTIGRYRCGDQFDYLLAPTQGDKWTFVCNDGTKHYDTVQLTLLPIQPEVDYAMD